MKTSVFTKVIFLCCFVFALSSAKSQYAAIPDSSFRQALIRLGYGTCFDSTHTMIDTTCSAVLAADSMNVGVSSILDLTGVRYFKGLRYLNCYHNPFTFLPQLPDSLTYLASYDGLLTFLPAMPNTLQYLNLGDNSLTNLTNIPDSLRFFSFENNEVSVLPPLPSQLNYLSCYGNELSALPPLPSSLTYLDCGTNMIDSLPALPASLTELACGVNHLTAIPVLPPYLVHLYCNNNYLTGLPSLPDSLQRLYCFGNILTVLPSLPGSISWLDCSYNQLSTLPVLPDSLHSFSCRVNMSLYCLPQLNKVVYFSFDSTSVSCLPDYPQENVLCTPSLSSLAVCDLSNPHGCLTYTGISEVSANDLSIYPNPASDILTIKMINNNTPLNYTLIDLEGRTLRYGLLINDSTNIDISDLNSGIYLLQVGGKTFKVVKN